MKPLKKGKNVNATINKEKFVLEEIFLKDLTKEDLRDPARIINDPCLNCFLLKKVKEARNPISPKNCLACVPSCLGRDREDKRSIYYKLKS